MVSEVKREGYDAVLLPGDLLDGMAPNEKRELQAVLEMLKKLSDLEVPTTLCTGNHDEGLIEHLLVHRNEIPSVKLDEETLEIGKIRVRSIPYIGALPFSAEGGDIWLLHEPPGETRSLLDELKASKQPIDKAAVEALAALWKNPEFREALPGHLPSDASHRLPSSESRSSRQDRRTAVQILVGMFSGRRDPSKVVLGKGERVT